MSDSINEFDKRLAVIEVVLSNIKDNTASISPMKQTIDRLSIIQENQQKSLDLVTKTLEHMKKTSMVVDNLEKQINEHGDIIEEQDERINTVERIVDEYEDKITIINTKIDAETDFRKEKMKSKYTLLGVIITAFASLAVSLLAIFI